MIEFIWSGFKTAIVRFNQKSACEVWQRGDCISLPDHGIECALVTKVTRYRTSLGTCSEYEISWN